jgi:hypothetical protein
MKNIIHLQTSCLDGIGLSLSGKFGKSTSKSSPRNAWALPHHDRGDIQNRGVSERRNPVIQRRDSECWSGGVAPPPGDILEIGGNNHRLATGLG